VSEPIQPSPKHENGSLKFEPGFWTKIISQRIADRKASGGQPCMEPSADAAHNAETDEDDDLLDLADIGIVSELNKPKRSDVGVA
jgi:hypothetical protein